MERFAGIRAGTSRRRRVLVAVLALVLSLAGAANLRAVRVSAALATPDPRPLHVAIVDQFYPGDEAFADAAERDRQLLLHDAADIDGDHWPEPLYHGDLVRCFVETEGIETVAYPVDDPTRPKLGILQRLQEIARDVDAGAALDAVLLCWESSAPTAAFGDSLRRDTVPAFRATLRRWAATSESWRQTDAIITALESLTARGLTVVTIAGNSGARWVNAYSLASGVLTVGGSEADEEGRGVSDNPLIAVQAPSVYAVQLVCAPDRPCFGFDLDGDGIIDVPLTATSRFRDQGGLPRDSGRALKGTSFAAPTALRTLARAGKLPHASPPP